MNEQIKKLAEHAGLKIESWMTNPPKPFGIVGSVEDFEKFAELIVHDCVKIAELKEQGYNEYDSDVSVGWYIKEHFGIK